MKSTTYDETIERACTMYLSDWAYDWRLLKAQYWQESRFNPIAKSNRGAEGIAQIVAGTWSDWAPKCGYEDEPRSNGTASIYVGAAYMNNMLKQWYWDRPSIDRIALALASYNAGLGNLLKAQAAAGNPSLYRDIVAALPDITGHDNASETYGYVKNILVYWNGAVIG